MDDEIKKAVDRFRKIDGLVRIVTHYDTDGITAGAILATALKRMDKPFKISVINQLSKKVIEDLRDESNKILVLLDMGSAHLEELNKVEGEIFILDHHEFPSDLPLSKNICFLNPHLNGEEAPASAISYLFAKELDSTNSDLAHLAILGLIGDFADQDLGKIGSTIIHDAKEVQIKNGLLLFPSTRPLNKALEFASIYIPGVTGSSVGALNLIREAGIKLRDENKFKTLLDLTEEEISRLLTLITLKKADIHSIIGKIYLIKFFNHLEDARELSSLINACGRLGYADTALAFCMGNKKAKANAESIYLTYKHELISGLNWISLNDKIEGEGYFIINAGTQIKDSIIGTLISILASSFVYPENTILIGLAKTDDKRIKVSARVVGHGKCIDLKKILEKPAEIVGGESGGHKGAAGCFIPADKETPFIELLQKELNMIQLEIKV
jgi:RecJ-like exonuclease